MPENEMFIQEGPVYDDYTADEEDVIEGAEEDPEEEIDEEGDVPENDEEEEPDEEDEEQDDEDDEEHDDEDDEDLDEIVKHTDEVAQMLAKHDIDYNGIVDEFQSSGKLSQSTMEKLQKAGYTPGAIKSYINGQQALYEQYRTKVVKTVGGDKSYAKLQKWTKDNLTHKEKQAFNAAVESGDLTKAKFAVKGLQARYEASEGREAKLVKGKSTGAARVKGFTSLAEYSKATEDPRYNRDKAYTTKVNTRILAMDFIN